MGFVRWTEQRNFEAVLDMLADGRLNVAPLVSHRFAIEEAETAYALIGSNAPSLGVVLQYSGNDAPAQDASTLRVAPATKPGAVGLGFIGAGNYAAGVLIGCAANLALQGGEG